MLNEPAFNGCSGHMPIGVIDCFVIYFLMCTMTVVVPEMKSPGWFSDKTKNNADE